MGNRFIWASLFAGTAVSLLLSYGVATQQIVLGAPDAGWHYGYVRPFTLRAVGAALLVTGTCAALLLVPTPSAGRREWVVVLTWIAAGVAMQGLLRSLTPHTFEHIFRNEGANAFYTVTLRHDAGDVLSFFAELRQRWPLHAQSNMPGKILLIHALELVSSSPKILPWLIVVVSNAGGALIYAFVRDLFSNRQVALFSLVLYLFVPAKLFFFPLLNTVTPVVILLCTWLLVRWLQTGSRPVAALLGVALYGVALFEPLPLVMGLFFAALVGRALWQGDTTRRRLTADVAAGIAGFGAAYAAMRAWFGFDLIDAFRAVSAHALAFNVESQRPYAIWIGQNLREFAFGVGACQAVLFAVALIEGLRAPFSRDNRLLRPITVVTASLLAVVVITDLAGVNRGEVIRLWIFLACFCQIPAAYLCARLGSRLALILVVASTALQSALATTMIGFILL